MKKILVDAVYFERKKMNIGAGGTSKTKVENIHYHIVEIEGDQLNVEMLNAQGKRTGMVVETIDKETFLSRFFSCFEHECQFFPKLSQVEGKERAKKLAENGDRLKEHNEMKQAELEYGNALKFDEKSARANYGMAKVLIETGREDDGKNLLKKLTKMDDVFEKENKHLFNEIGIDLRKQKLYEEASEYYTKAISIDPEDEALHYNLARLHKDCNEYQEALNAIKKALKIKPDFKEGKEFHDWLQARLTPEPAQKKSRLKK